MTALKLAIFWGAYAYFPLLIVCGWLMTRGSRWWTTLATMALIPATVLAYARFVEPQRLVTKQADIDLAQGAEDTVSVRIALVADTHYGIFRNAMPLKRIVAAIAKHDVDAVLIAGDLTYHPRPSDIENHLAAFKDLKAPAFAVLGNHDVGFPGPDLSDPVLAALSANNISLVENRALEVEINGVPLIIAGSSDIWARRQNYEFRASLPDGLPVLMLTHNPDTALIVPDDFEYNLMFAGHTHGGQIRLPFLYQRAIPTQWPFDKGLHTYPSGAGDRLVYVTPGTGMVGLPMRFLMPPQIDILTLTLPAPDDRP